MKPIRIALYSHDSVGLGHVRRNLALAHSLTQQLPGLTGRTVTGVLITGTALAPGFPAPVGWDWVLLPGVEKGPEGYVPRRLNVPMHDLVSLRALALEGILAGFLPDLIVIDRHATGIHHELESALRRVRAAGNVRIVLGLREVLDSPESAATEWAGIGGPQIVKELFDAIWVYGDPSIHDPVGSGEIPFSLSRLVQYTGYLAAGRPAGNGISCMSGPYCMTTMGGGADGHPLASIAAAARLPVGLAHLIVTGPQMPADELLEVRRHAQHDVKIVATVDDVIHHMRHASAVVSMGGYNSVCEIMSTDVPALIVPRSQSRAEQRIRARSLAEAGYLDYHEIGTLTPQILSDWLALRLGTTIDRRRLHLDGLVRVPRLAAELLGQAAETVAPRGATRLYTGASRVAI